jgi:hypothetical protein
LAADGEEDVAHGLAIHGLAPHLDRPHRGLYETDHPGLRDLIAPGFEPVQRGQHEVRLGGRLARPVGEAHNHGHLGEGLREAGLGRHGVDGIDVAQDQHLDLALGHGLGEREHVGVGAGPRGLAAEADTLAHSADGDVEQVHRLQHVGRVRPRHGGAPAQHEPGLRRAEGVGHALDRVRGHPGLGGHRRHVHALHRAREGARVHAGGDEAFVHDHLEHGEGERPLRARRIADPLVGVGSRHGQPRLDVHEGARLPAGERVHLREGGRVAHRREPGLEEVGAEGDQIAGLLDRILGNRVAAEGGAVGRADRLQPERLVGDAGPRAQRLRPLVEEAGEAARLEPGHQRDLPALLGAREGAELVGEDLLGGLPRRELPVHHGAPKAIRMVQPLERGVPADAETSPVDGMVGIALELDDTAVAVLREHAAAGGALAADRGEVGGHARDDILRGRDVRVELLRGRPAPGGGGRRAGDRDDPEERPAINPAHRISLLIPRWMSRRDDGKGAARGSGRSSSSTLRPSSRSEAQCNLTPAPTG